MISLEITGAEEVARKLRELTDDTPQDVVAEMPDVVFPVWAGLVTYPNRPSPSKYVRTYAYREGVKVEAHREGNIVTGEITQPPEGLWLHGNQEGYPGAWMHLGIWDTLTSILERFMPVMVSRLDAVLTATIKRLGL